MARLTIDYESGSNPGSDAVTWLCAQELIEHLRDTIRDGSVLEHHIGTMNTLLAPIIDRLCMCDVLPEKVDQAKAA